MKKAFRELNIYLKCSVISGLFLVLIVLGTIPLYFFSLKEIPLGIILGMGINILFYVITGILDKKYQDGYRWTLVLTTLRFVIFGALLVLIGLCYYKWDIKYFNIFAFFGGYIAVLIIFVILHILGNRKEKQEK